ncbi:MAG: hypothetical protein ACXIUD_08720 [Mongoliitalea sp.]
MKFLHYNRINANFYFWRTTTGMELDWLEEKGGVIYAFEAKWNPNRRASLPSAFLESYPGTVYQVVTRDNYTDFLLGS